MAPAAGVGSRPPPGMLRAAAFSAPGAGRAVTDEAKRAAASPGAREKRRRRLLALRREERAALLEGVLADARDVAELDADDLAVIACDVAGDDGPDADAARAFLARVERDAAELSGLLAALSLAAETAREPVPFVAAFGKFDLHPGHAPTLTRGDARQTFVWRPAHADSPA